MSEYELYHYGVIGMKWGVRRARKKEAKQAYRKATDAAFKKYERGIAGVEKNYKRGQNLSDADLKREQKIESDYKKAEAKAKADYKKALKSKSNDVSNAVAKGYHKGAAKRVTNQSTGKTIAQAMIFGSYGALKYNQGRAEGMNRGKAAAAAVLSSWANNMTFESLARTERRNRRRPMDEKPHKNRSWDEKPHKENAGRI